MRFLDHRLDAAAAVVPAHLRNHAERALVVAAFGDLHVGVVTRGGETARAGRVVEVGRKVDAEDRGWGRFDGGLARFRGPRPGPRDPDWIAPVERQRGRAGRARRARPWLDGFEDMRDVAGAEHGVDLRDLLLQGVAVAFGEAAGDDQPAAGGLLPGGHLQNRVDRLLLGAVDEGAGVHDDDVGAVGVGRDLVAGLFSCAEHDLGIDEVLRAAEGNEADLHSAARGRLEDGGVEHPTTVHEPSRATQVLSDFSA